MTSLEYNIQHFVVLVAGQMLHCCDSFCPTKKSHTVCKVAVNEFLTSLSDTLSQWIFILP